MILIITKKASEDEMQKMAEDLEGYVKVVVDLERAFLAGGGKRHVDAEQIMLENGSKQDDLWGGGYDTETMQIDYNSMINVRPSQGNMSRDIMSAEIRKIFDEIVSKLLS